MKKILFINTTQGGGAFVAAHRYSMGLNQLDTNSNSSVITLEGISKGDIEALGDNVFNRMRSRLNHLVEKVYFLFFQKNKSVRFQFSIPLIGFDIATMDIVKEADIIHLHWINKGFLSIDSLEEILKLNKPVFWTMHDMWPFTGGCHHSRGCDHFMRNCGNCVEYLKNPSDTDLSFNILNKKIELFKKYQIHFIAPSHWLMSLAQRSTLLKDQLISCIPNPINTELFSLRNKEEIKKKYEFPKNKKLLLFIAANLSNPYKGYDFFKQAIELLNNEKIAIVLVGQIKKEIDLMLDCEIIKMGYVNNTDTMIDLYNACDLFVTTSLEENLPNTIIEGMSCGLPAVAFDVGGISDIIDHKKNGYLSPVRDAEDLAMNITSYFELENHESYKEECRNKVLTKFSNEVIFKKLTELYQSVE